MSIWQGVFPAACTQFDDDQGLNVRATLKHLDAMIEGGIHGLVLLGTVGENCSLEYYEKLDLLREAVKHVAGRVPVLTGVAEYTTERGCRFASDVERIGVDGLMVLPGMVYNSDARESVEHFRTIARSTALPIMIYNNPVSYRVDLLPEAFVELAGEKNIVAIKESSHDPRRITDLRNAVGNRYILFCGVDDLVMESFVLGVQGWISGLVNAFPAETMLLWNLLNTGRFEEAQKVYAWYTPLLHLDTMPKLVQYIKLTAAECGYGTEQTRPPRLPLHGEERERILKIIRKGIAERPAVDAAVLT